MLEVHRSTRNVNLNGSEVICSGQVQSIAARVADSVRVVSQLSGICIHLSRRGPSDEWRKPGKNQYWFWMYCLKTMQWSRKRIFWNVSNQKVIRISLGAYIMECYSNFGLCNSQKVTIWCPTVSSLYLGWLLRCCCERWTIVLGLLKYPFKFWK